MISHPHPATTCLNRAFHAALFTAAALAYLLVPYNAHAFTTSDTLYINQVPVRGIEEVLQLKPEYYRGHLYDYILRFIHNDGLDQVMVQMPDSTLWLAYGRHILLYAEDLGYVTSATVSAQPVKVLYLNDENEEVDTRPPLGPGLATVLLLIMAAGFGAGLISGMVARRSFAPLGRNPIFDHMFYGLIVGILVALLVYGLSDRRFDVDGLFANYTTEHMQQFMLQPPEK